MPTDTEEKASAAASAHAHAVYLALKAAKLVDVANPSAKNKEKIKDLKKKVAELPVLTKEIYGGKTRGGKTRRSTRRAARASRKRPTR